MQRRQPRTGSPVLASSLCAPPPTDGRGVAWAGSITARGHPCSLKWVTPAAPIPGLLEGASVSLPEKCLQTLHIGPALHVRAAGFRPSLSSLLTGLPASLLTPLSLCLLHSRQSELLKTYTGSCCVTA